MKAQEIINKIKRNQNKVNLTDIYNSILHNIRIFYRKLGIQLSTMQRMRFLMDKVIFLFFIQHYEKIKNNNQKCKKIMRNNNKNNNRIKAQMKCQQINLYPIYKKEEK